MKVFEWGKVVGIALGDLLQITDFQDYLGEQVLNVYHYRWASAPVLDNSAYEPLLTDFWTDVIGDLVFLQNSGLQHTTLQIKNLSNLVDFAEIPTGSFGTIAVDEDARLPSFMSLGFQLLRDSLVTRNGYKRFSGMVDFQTDGNEFSGDMAAVGNLEDALGAPLQIGIIDVAYPVIVKRPIPVPAGDDYLYSSVASVLFKGVGTQNTRKAGRGA